MTYVVALTGGMGSGKSTAANFFADLGVPIIDTDQIARDLVTPSQPALLQIIQKFGKSILQPNGELDRFAMREIIFNHPDYKLWLENLLHPLIREKVKAAISKVNYPYCIVVIPLLAEHYHDYQKIIDHIINIDVSEDKQILRAALRDQNPESLIKKMLESQVTRQDRIKIADTVLHNNDNVEALQNKIKELHLFFLK